MLNASNMNMFDDNCNKRCVNYLKKVLESTEYLKFDFLHLKKILQNEKVLNESDTLETLSYIFQLIKQCDKNFQMCSDLVYSFCLVINSSPLGTPAFFDILQKTESSNAILFQSDDIIHSIRENYSVLVLGMLRFFFTQKYEFRHNEFEILNSEVIKLIATELLNQNNINTLLCVSKAWTSVIRETSVAEETLQKFYSSIFSIVIIYWNIDISEFRNRVEDIFLECLNVNYENDVKNKSCAKTLNIVANMTTFRTIALDMSWSLPFKYYAYVIALKFIDKIFNLPEFLRYIQDDLRIGLSASLQNRRVISGETELFKYCTNSLPFHVWKEIFHPIVRRVLSAKSLIIANNFSRYWLPVIIRNFSQYAIEIYESISTNAQSRTAVHSKILFSLFKVCHLRKIKLLPVESDEQLANYLETFFYDSEDTLGELFAFICNLHDQSTLHSVHELRIMLKFLKNNARTSSTILRQHIFSSFARFVLRLICSCVRRIKNGKENIDSELKCVNQFLFDLNEFFVDGIQPGCSYQRKLIALSLYKIFLSYALCDCGGEIRKNNLKDVEKFINFVRANNMWNFNDRRNCLLLFRCLMDPCEDIQNLSFTLLRTFFDLTAIPNCSSVLSEVLILLNDNLFYKRNSGVSAVLSLICLSYNAGNDSAISLLKDVDYHMSDFTNAFLHLLETQVTTLQEDILNSALHHPLDSTIKILTFLMTHSSSPEYDVITESQIKKLISLLEIIVPILLRAMFVEKSADYAPSFEESDSALETIIESSSIVKNLNVRDLEQDEFQLKPLNQILSNFIWISLKVCSELESYLITSRITSLSETQLIRCSELVVMKLKLCRHKGVIESAGISLSNIVKLFTEHNVCENWLESLIKEIIHLIEHKSGATVSRKSAGLSLLVQNIVGNDRRPNKPLLSLCWNEFRRLLDVDYDKLNQNLSQELPQVHVLHFLKVLVADARNSAELFTFFEEITLICLKTLSVLIWTVRNAALQLFGAIVPKMVGQKNSQNDFGVRRSFEEVFIRMPALLDFIISSFEASVMSSSSKLTRDSDLVPLLIILANVQVCGVHSMEKSLLSKLYRLRESTRLLLSSELHFVRELASKSFVSLYCESEIIVFRDVVKDVSDYVSYTKTVGNISNENHLHGYLLMLKHAFTVYSNSPSFQEIITSHCSVLPFSSKYFGISLKSAALLYDLEIISCAKTDPSLIFNYLAEVLNNLLGRKHLLLGYDEWSYSLLRKVFKYCDEPSFFESVSFCLTSPHSSIKNNFLKILNTSLDYSESATVFDLLYDSLINHLSVFPEVDCLSLNCLFEAFLNLSPIVTKNFNEKYSSTIFERLIQLNSFEYQATNLRVLCLLMPPTACPSQVNELLVVLFQLFDLTKCNKDVRLNAAISLLTLLKKHSKPTDLHVLWVSIIQIVQDEEPEIRIIGCECYQNIRKNVDSCLNNEIVLTELFSLKIMLSYLPLDVTVHILWKTVVVNYFDVDSDVITNPFEQGILNVYKEDMNAVSSAGEALTSAVHLKSFEYFWRDSKKPIILYYETYIHQIMQTVKKILKNNLLVSSESYILAMRCFYLLLLFIELQEESFISVSCTNFDVISVNQEAENICLSLQESFMFSKLK